MIDTKELKRKGLKIALVDGMEFVVYFWTRRRDNRPVFMRQVRANLDDIHAPARRVNDVLEQDKNLVINGYIKG